MTNKELSDQVVLYWHSDNVSDKDVIDKFHDHIPPNIKQLFKYGLIAEIVQFTISYLCDKPDIEMVA